jgi:hypothetical protein
MVNYQNGKVYKIEPICDHEENEIYIGSTTKTYLSQRMDTHRNKFRQWQDGKYPKVSAFEIFEKYGSVNCQILLLELYPCNSKDELLAREKHYIKIMQCLNKRNPIRTKEEKVAQHKVIARAYYENNKELVKQRATENRKLHHAQQNESIICICKCHYTRPNKKRHLLSKKHQNYVANHPIDTEEPIDV